MTNTEKVTENRLRRIAARRGYTLTKSRTRDPKALNYGRWAIFNGVGDLPVRIDGEMASMLTLAEIEEFFK